MVTLQLGEGVQNFNSSAALSSAACVRRSLTMYARQTRGVALCGEMISRSSRTQQGSSSACFIPPIVTFVFSPKFNERRDFEIDGTHSALKPGWQFTRARVVSHPISYCSSR